MLYLLTYHADSPLARIMTAKGYEYKVVIHDTWDISVEDRKVLFDAPTVFVVDLIGAVNGIEKMNSGIFKWNMIVLLEYLAARYQSAKFILVVDWSKLAYTDDLEDFDRRLKDTLFFDELVYKFYTGRMIHCSMVRFEEKIGYAG